MTKTSNPTVHQLAASFTEHLRGYLTEEQLEQVAALNEVEPNAEICHSHDFCDANQAMADALADFGLEFNGQDESQLSLINRAWSIARDNDFDAESLGDAEYRSQEQAGD